MIRVVWITESKPFNEASFLAQALKGKVEILTLESQSIGFGSPQKVIYTTQDASPHCIASEDLTSAIDEIDPDIVVFDSMLAQLNMRGKEIHSRILVYRASETPSELCSIPQFEPNAISRLHAFVDHTVSISPAMTEYIESLGYRNVHTIPFTIPEPDPKFIIDLEEKDNAIVIGGCLRTRQSVLLGMEVGSMVLAQEPQYTLHFFNDDFTPWDHKAFRQGIRGVRIIFVVTRKHSLHEVDYREVMAKSKLFCHTSKSAHTLYEQLHAMSYGLPVVMAENELFNICSPLFAGFVPPHRFVKAVLRSLNAPELWKGMSEAVKNEAQQFYITKWADEWVDYFKLLQERLTIFKDPDYMQRY